MKIQKGQAFFLRKEVVMVRDLDQEPKEGNYITVPQGTRVVADTDSDGVGNVTIYSYHSTCDIYYARVNDALLIDASIPRVRYTRRPLPFVGLVDNYDAYVGDDSFTEESPIEELPVGTEVTIMRQQGKYATISAMHTDAMRVAIVPLRWLSEKKEG